MVVIKYHFMEGLFSKRSTFIPKKPDIKVRGRKIKVTQDNLHMLVPSCNDCRESLIATDLYIYHGYQ